MYYLLTGLYVVICFLLLVVVLLQQGKGGDIAAAFGGSSSQTAFGARAGATVLTRATAVLGTLFMLSAFSLALMSRSVGGGSVVSGVSAPAPDPGTTLPGGSLPAAPPAATPAPPPATPPATTKPPVEKGKGGK